LPYGALTPMEKRKNYEWDIVFYVKA
jgi:hypothetical protein